ncbi:MAG TPA: cytochrome c biogenesis heme-transporting ATPase CcmA [Casimicrobiaceae bacterium]|jgi:heme exporter protein A
MLEAQHLAAQRGAVTLFAGVDFTLTPGEALLVTGANGSGKTTLLKMVAGLAHPAAGALAWQGIARAPFDAATRATTLYIGHAPALKDELTAEENLRSLAVLHGTSAEWAAVREALRAWTLEAQRALPARVLSQGQRRRVGLARLRLVSRPLWVLDEPTTALDAAGIATLQDQLATHLDQGGLAMIATHHPLALREGTWRTLQLQ